MIADTFRVAIELDGTGITDKVVNVIHIRGTSGTAAADVNDSVQTRWATCFKSIIPTQYDWVQTTVQKLDGSAGINFPWTGDMPSSTQASMPMNVALCMSWRTLLAGRSHRGRSYIGPLGNNFVDPSVPDKIDASLLASMKTNGLVMVAGFIADGLELVVASYTLASAEGVDDVVPNPLICTQRKRVNGR